MDEKAKRAQAAYQRWGKREENAGDDWLARLAENDFSALSSQSGETGNAGVKREDVQKHSEITPAVVSNRAQPLEKVSRTNEKNVDSKYRRVAKFLILIGSEQAAKVLSNLDKNQIEEISREIVSVRRIDRTEADAIFAEFYDLIADSSRYGGAIEGGPEEARRLLYAAFGPEKGEAILRRTALQSEGGMFGFLEDFSGEQLMMLLRDESPAAGAMIFSRIEPKLAAAALRAADPIWRQETVKRIGRLGRVAPEVLEKVAESLREKARHISTQRTDELDGMGALAAILKHSDLSFGERILTDLAQTDADLSRTIKERLFTLDDVVKAEDRPIQEKLHGMNAQEIAVLIKGRPAAFAEKILSNVSANRRIEIQTENDIMGPIPKKDSDEAIKKFLDWFREEREKGAILMVGDELVE